MKKIGYLILLSVFSLKTYIKDVVVLQQHKRKIFFLHDYHWDDKSKSDSQEALFTQFFNLLPTDSLVHLETTKGPHSQKEIEIYTINNKDESCATIFSLQQAMFAGKKHNYSFTLKSFEVRTAQDTKYSIQIPYRIAFDKEGKQKELIAKVNNWMKATIQKAEKILQSSDFKRLFNKNNIHKVIKQLSSHLKQVKLPHQAQEVYKISSILVNIKLLQNILNADNQIQVVIGGRDHLLIVAQILKNFKGWQQIYAAKGYKTSLWGKKIIEKIQA